MDEIDVVKVKNVDVESESETELVEKVVEKLTKNKVVKPKDDNAMLKAERISKGRKIGAITRNKKTDEIKKKSLLFDKYLENQLTYEEIIESGFKMKNVEPTKIPNVVITKTKTEPIKEEVQEPIKKKVQRKKVIRKVMPKVKVEPVKSNGKMSNQELEDFLNS